MVYRDFENPSAVGGDFYFGELAKGLAELGHHVTILCSDFEGSKLMEVIQKVEIFRLKDSWLLPLQMFKTYLKKFRGVDIIIEEAIGGQRLPFLGTLYIKEPLVAVWHQRHNKIFREQYPLVLSLPLSFFEQFLAILYRRDTIITPSYGAKAKLSPLGFKFEKIKVVYDGVGKDFSNVKLNKKREDIIVCLGKMRRYKRIDHSLLALALVRKKIKTPLRLVIAGKVSEIDRGYVEWLFDFARKLKIEKYG